MDFNLNFRELDNDSSSDRIMALLRHVVNNIDIGSNFSLIIQWTSLSISTYLNIRRN